MSDPTPLTQADIDKAVEAALEPLRAKNVELLTEAKNAKAELRKSKEIDPADLTKLEEENDRLKADLSKAQKEAKDATKAAEVATKALENETGFTAKLLIQDGIRSALIGVGVKDEDYIDALTTKFASGANVVTEGDARKAMVGDKAVADAIKEWAGSDAGKKFVSAPVNSGGGAPGGKGGGGGKVLSTAEFNAMQPKARASFMADGGQVTEAA